jgi:hypothetical protein
LVVEEVLLTDQFKEMRRYGKKKDSSEESSSPEHEFGQEEKDDGNIMIIIQSAVETLRTKHLLEFTSASTAFRTRRKDRISLRNMINRGNEISKTVGPTAAASATRAEAGSKSLCANMIIR